MIFKGDIFEDYLHDYLKAPTSNGATNTIYAPYNGIAVIGAAQTNYNCSIKIYLDDNLVESVSGAIKACARAYIVKEGTKITVEQQGYLAYNANACPARLLDIAFYTIQY